MPLIIAFPYINGRIHPRDWTEIWQTANVRSRYRSIPTQVTRLDRSTNRCLSFRINAMLNKCVTTLAPRTMLIKLGLTQMINFCGDRVWSSLMMTIEQKDFLFVHSASEVIINRCRFSTGARQAADYTGNFRSTH